jgi:hypothetical protein
MSIDSSQVKTTEELPSCLLLSDGENRTGERPLLCILQQPASRSHRLINKWQNIFGGRYLCPMPLFFIVAASYLT